MEKFKSPSVVELVADSAGPNVVGITHLTQWGLALDPVSGSLLKRPVTLTIQGYTFVPELGFMFLFCDFNLQAILLISTGFGGIYHR